MAMTVAQVRLERARADHAQQQVAAEVLHGPAEHLLVRGDRTSTLDSTQRMDGCTDAKITHALRRWSRGSRTATVGVVVALTRGVGGTVLGRDARETDTNGTDVRAQHVAAVQGLASADRIIETLKVD